MKETGKVIKITHDEVTIEVIPPKVCTKCSACHAAQAQNITLSGEKARGLKLGESVSVEIDTSPILKVYTLFYGVPLLVFMTTILLLYLLFKSPLMSLAGSVLTVAVTYVLVGRYAKNRQELYPKICPRD